MVFEFQLEKSRQLTILKPPQVFGILHLTRDETSPKDTLDGVARRIRFDVAIRVKLGSKGN
jgi:hypothetical protein